MTINLCIKMTRSECPAEALFLIVRAWLPEICMQLSGLPWSIQPSSVWVGIIQATEFLDRIQGGRHVFSLLFLSHRLMWHISLRWHISSFFPAFRPGFPDFTGFQAFGLGQFKLHHWLPGSPVCRRQSTELLSLLRGKHISS